MRYLPVSIDLAGRLAVVVGSGEMATARVRLLLDVGACVRMVSSEVPSEVRELADQGSKLTLVERKYETGDLTDAALVFVATDDRAVHKLVSDEANTRGTLLNVIDEPQACSFIMPAMVELGAVSVAVSTGGASPALAQRIRDEIAATLGPEYATAADHMASLRERFERGPARMQAFSALLQSGLLEALRRGDPARVERMTQRVCEGLEPRRSEELEKN